MERDATAQGARVWNDSLAPEPARASCAVLASDLRAAALQVRVGEVMSPRVNVTRAEASAAMCAATLTALRLRNTPVVDDRGKLVGIVSVSDLAPGFRVADIGSATVGDVMTSPVHALPEGAPLAYAMNLLARSGLRELPVVSSDGVVVGVVTSNDVLRWVARGIGYVLPDA